MRDLEDRLPGDREYLRGDRDLRYDLLLLRGLPVRDLVLARPLESGDPDLDLVLGLGDLLRLRALEPDPGTSPRDTPGEDITSQSVFYFTILLLVVDETKSVVQLSETIILMHVNEL